MSERPLKWWQARNWFMTTTTAIMLTLLALNFALIAEWWAALATAFLAGMAWSMILVERCQHSAHRWAEIAKEWREHAEAMADRSQRGEG